MKYRFVLGIGRSGTTLLGRLMALSTSPMKFITEPFPGSELQGNLKYIDPSFVKPFPGSEEVKNARDIIVDLSVNNMALKKDFSEKCVARSDFQPEFLLIKEVHALLAFPMILSGLDYKIAVITRDTSRVIDSYFHGHTKKQRRYLIEEYKYLKNYIGDEGKRYPNYILNAALQRVSPEVIRHIKQPSWMIRELLRQVSATEITKLFLVAWARTDERVVDVAFEELCSSPVEVCKKLYNFLELEYDDTTISDIEKITKGKSIAYYATDKDSSKILKQEYKFLTKRNLLRIKNLVDKKEG